MISRFLALAAGRVLVPFKMAKTETGMALIKKSMSSVFRFCCNNHN